MGIVHFFLIFSAIGAASQPSAVVAQRARAAVARGVPFLESQIVDWNASRDCVSCHNGLPILWSLNQARASGFPVREDLLGNWTRKAQAIHRRIPAESLAYLLLGRDRQSRDETAYLTLADQLTAGRPQSWQPGGQRILQLRRPSPEGGEVALWSRLALASIRRDEAAAKPPPATDLATTELLVLHLLLAAGGGDESQFETLVQRLGELQLADGSWPWRAGSGGDPIATGQALYALARTGRADDRLERGQGYLADVQQTNGSWVSTPTLDGWNDDVTDESVFWSTAWAILGLTSCLDQ